MDERCLKTIELQDEAGRGTSIAFVCGLLVDHKGPHISSGSEHVGEHKEWCVSWVNRDEPYLV